jgi:hypothetical protein
MTFSMLDELVDAVKDLGADCLMVRSEHLRAYRALLRTVNAARLKSWSKLRSSDADPQRHSVHRERLHPGY